MFVRLCNSILEVNTKKYSFWLKYINYLGYIITWGDIKPDPKKFQGIINLGITTNTNQLLFLLFQRGVG